MQFIKKRIRRNEYRTLPMSHSISKQVRFSPVAGFLPVSSRCCVQVKQYKNHAIRFCLPLSLQALRWQFTEVSTQTRAHRFFLTSLVCPAEKRLTFSIYHCLPDNIFPNTRWRAVLSACSLNKRIVNTLQSGLWKTIRLKYRKDQVAKILESQKLLKLL